METLTDARQRPDARLLVVEDEPNILELLSASLRYAGFDVVTAAEPNGGGGLAQASTGPDLIVARRLARTAAASMSIPGGCVCVCRIPCLPTQGRHVTARRSRLAAGRATHQHQLFSLE